MIARQKVETARCKVEAARRRAIVTLAIITIALV